MRRNKRHTQQADAIHCVHFTNMHGAKRHTQGRLFIQPGPAATVHDTIIYCTYLRSRLINSRLNLGSRPLQVGRILPDHQSIPLLQRARNDSCLSYTVPTAIFVRTNSRPAAARIFVQKCYFLLRGINRLGILCEPIDFSAGFSQHDLQTATFFGQNMSGLSSRTGAGGLVYAGLCT